MKPEAAAPRGRRPQGHPLGALFASAVFAFVLAGCGISLSADRDEADIFKRLTIEGAFTAGSRLSLTLRYTQPYPVRLTVDCDLLAGDGEGAATPAATNTPTKELMPTPFAIPRSRPTPANKVLDILRERLDPNPEGGPVGEVTPVPGTIQRSFVAPERPGSYVVECFTREDESNFIQFPLTIAAAPTPTATP